jgi:dTDP-4-dehydrorhamnose reductase
MSMKRKILLTGRDGQLGHECRLACPPEVELIAVGRAECDLADPAAAAALVRELRPEVLIHAAAWTAVDAAEAEEETATVVNGESVGALAAACATVGARMLAVSTDYVFSGEGDRPWQEDDPVDPLNAYGRSKLAGERALAAALPGAGCSIRTSWVYGRRGHNFVHTMLRLMREGRELKVVDDQRGCPTWAGGLAASLWALASWPAGRDLPALLHHTDGGIVSWHGFAAAIREEALSLGLEVGASRVLPCPSSEYPTPARRPAWSPLAFSGAWSLVDREQEPWRDALRAALPLLVAEADASRPT